MKLTFWYFWLAGNKRQRLDEAGEQSSSASSFKIEELEAQLEELMARTKQAEESSKIVNEWMQKFADVAEKFVESGSVVENKFTIVDNKLAFTRMERVLAEATSLNYKVSVLFVIHLAVK